MLLTQTKIAVTSKEMDCEFQAYDKHLEFLSPRVHTLLVIADL